VGGGEIHTLSPQQQQPVLQQYDIQRYGNLTNARTAERLAVEAAQLDAIEIAEERHQIQAELRQQQPPSCTQQQVQQTVTNGGNHQQQEQPPTRTQQHQQQPNQRHQQQPNQQQEQPVADGGGQQQEQVAGVGGQPAPNITATNQHNNCREIHTSSPQQQQPVLQQPHQCRDRYGNGSWCRALYGATCMRVRTAEQEQQQSTQELYRQQPWLYRQRYGHGDATPQQRALAEQLDAEAVQLDMMQSGLLKNGLLKNGICIG
jgi:hypothetical protein